MPARTSLFHTLFAAAFLAACTPLAPASQPDREAHGESFPASDLIREAIHACRTHSMNRDTIDWSDLQTQALEKLRQGESTDAVLRSLVARLGDGHSSYFTAEQASALTQQTNDTPQPTGNPALPPLIQPSGRLVHAGDASFGYLRVPYLITMDPAQMNAFVNTIDRLQTEFIAAGASGWIIDLRRNVGGNQWPMLAALAPILGDGPHGSIVLPNGHRMTWGTAPGTAWMNEPDSIVFKADAANAPSTHHWPVAVLTDQRTASSGETIVVSLRGRPNTRSFGDPTSGRSSANVSVSLSDGSLLNITTSAMHDRTGHALGGPIQPDELFGLQGPIKEAPFPGSDGTADPVLDRAIEWITNYTLQLNPTPAPAGE